MEGAADGEGAVGDVVGLAAGPVFEPIVNEEVANFKDGGFVGFFVGLGVGLGGGDATDGSEGDGVGRQGSAEGRSGFSRRMLGGDDFF